ncbi:MAG: LysR family transcriptional regulator [Tardiphaga sp.]|nr:LysR family transcriptional regulator [Tardiphaga sp.]
MAVFVRVAELGSFSAIAAALGISPQIVGKHITALEARLGVQLINRTTRRQSLTEFGASYCDNCRSILADLDVAEARALNVRTTPKGLLRINAPVTFGSHVLIPVITDYLKAHPEVQVDLTLSDRFVDPVEEGYEAVFRLGPLADSATLVARALAPYRLIACASPAYLAERGVPQAPDDLRRHDCLGFSYWSGALGQEWQFSRGEEVFHVPVDSRFKANDWRALYRSALLGFGITIGFEAAMAEDLAAGRLVRVLPGFDGLTRPLHLLYARDRRMTPKLRHFIDAVLRGFAPRASLAVIPAK